MEQRSFERLGRSVGIVGLGAWQLGSEWGEIGEVQALALLESALEAEIDFIDTADVYGDGRSERLIGKLLTAHPDTELMVATKMGRRLDQVPENYVLDNFISWTDRSRANLGLDTIDLVQLHCPPSLVYRSDEVFDSLDELVALGRISAYGVSVETCAQALIAIARPNVVSVQIILNALRLKPIEQVLGAAQKAGVGVIIRLPLASGLLAGKYDLNTTFPSDDHRAFNRNGEAFDIGETFAGVPFEIGLEAVRALAPTVPDELTIAQFALRWVLDQEGVTVAIPGARDSSQVISNAAAANASELTRSQHEAVLEVYKSLIKPLVHERW